MIGRQIDEQMKMIYEHFGQQGVINREELVHSAHTWFTELLRYDELMQRKTKTVSHVKARAVMCIELFERYRRIRQIVWKDIPDDCWKWGHNNTPSLNAQGEGKLEGMELKEWHALQASNEPIDGEFLPSRFKPTYLQNVEQKQQASPQKVSPKKEETTEQSTTEKKEAEKPLQVTTEVPTRRAPMKSAPGGDDRARSRS
ncbi:MAG: hypothetical protein GY739_01625, partial [Mesoflavibacter sp.]|nr:hypothetical protein [Mesoflavibacter sp.]